MRPTPDPTLDAATAAGPPPGHDDPATEVLVRQIIERVADQWTMLVLEALEAHGTVRFGRLQELVGGISQKMLTQTLRHMERDGLVARTVHPEVPPRVEYALTDLGRTLGAAFCGVWVWAETHHARIEQARRDFATAARKRKPVESP